MTDGAFKLEKLSPKKIPTWPAVSIFLLVVLSAVLPPGLLTGMNLYLLLLASIWWVASRKPFDRNLLGVIYPFIIIIVIGLASARALIYTSTLKMLGTYLMLQYFSA